MRIFSTCLAVGVSFLAGVSNALYKNPGPVVELTADNFKKEVL